MRVTLEITVMPDRKQFFRIYDDINEEFRDITGTGWTIKDAVDDFICQIQEWSFYDDDTIIPQNRENVAIKARKVHMMM